MSHDHLHLINDGKAISHKQQHAQNYSIKYFISRLQLYSFVDLFNSRFSSNL
jgi:hypothetical protein